MFRTSSFFPRTKPFVSDQVTKTGRQASVLLVQDFLYIELPTKFHQICTCPSWPFHPVSLPSPRPHFSRQAASADMHSASGRRASWASHTLCQHEGSFRMGTRRGPWLHKHKHKRHTNVSGRAVFLSQKWASCPDVIFAQKRPCCSFFFCNWQCILLIVWSPTGALKIKVNMSAGRHGSGWTQWYLFRLLDNYTLKPFNVRTGLRNNA